jgi:myo-inositol 2-dehydrogenase/D-chiro-inositol 1-dehydrogenase
MLNVGLLGAGRIGRVHAGNIAAHPESRIAAISDVRADAAASLARETGAAPMATTDILSDSAIDAVVIATATDTHADLIEQATRADKKVFCEKPVDLDIARARDCRAVAAATGQPVMLGFNRRFDPSFAALKSAFDAGDIGKGELLSVTSFDPSPPPADYVKVSGGLFRDMAIHDFDMACWLMGGMPERVSASASCLVDPAIGAAGDVDTAIITLAWSDGRLAVIRNSRRAAYGYDQRLELLGERGLLSAGNMLENTVSRAGADGIVAAKPEHFFLERYAKAYVAEWAAFVECALRGAALPVTLDDGINALALADAAGEAAATGQAVRVQHS